ncbi:MAG TPA: NAD+ synthase [Denitromonas sp.]|uniref:NAD+ synthase n=1 Tax=Denitromonas sp. TaxID=2734609 RepID=UPI001D578347|nr:NAD+ synthase [Rhodocyclaceae bacterium]MCP5221485.1 NAD+ synthase [Zoogloeaceae bacterium]HQU88296.1 NAD+ synthase [Denitromonas sp.]HQV14779.1 NAD+ synthase [Denitromonas sp.]
MKTSLAIAVAQFNPVVGDLSGNVAQIRAAMNAATAEGARLLLTPELSICGYPPEDLLLRPDFYDSCRKAVESLALQSGELAVVVGYPEADGDTRYNAAAVLRHGRIVAHYRKQRLPNYEVFDELRYFGVGDKPCVFEVDGVRCGLLICADLWGAEPTKGLIEAGADVILTINASPCHLSKQQDRYRVAKARASESGLPVLYANMVGGQDELVFDGASFAMQADGSIAWQAPAFDAHASVVRLNDGAWLPATVSPLPEVEEEAYTALVVGVRDYLGKNGFPGAIIGLSGGIDSALTLAVAVDALGADKVRAVMMPSPYTAQMSLDDAAEMARILGVRYDVLPIEPAMQVFAGMLEAQFAGLAEDTTEENLQSRIRGMLLMALSNKTGSIVLTTGNKSEMATGYATLYGDMAGGFAVLKDVYKTLVYRLSVWRNARSAIIPENIITRPPSAELKPDQVDQDSLPPYAVLDAIIEAYMERDESPREIVAQGYDEAVVRRTVGMLKRNEYKRRQSPVGIRLTRRAFGKDWRFPITARYQDPY